VQRTRPRTRPRAWATWWWEFDRSSLDEKGNKVLEGAVTIRVGKDELRLQADRIV
jgi:hypothetical protein